MPQAREKAQRILIVDDSITVVKKLAKILRSYGFDALEMVDGTDLLNTIRAQKVELIILDLVMPAVSGLELIKQIRQNKELASLPVIVLSAMKEDQTLVDALEAGADDYVTKPFNPTILMARIRTQLRNRVLLSRLENVNTDLKQAREHEMEAERLKTAIEMAGATAHKLNQPLTSIVCYADMLLKKVEQESEDYRAIKSICDESARMTEILRKMAELTELRISNYVGDTTIVDIDSSTSPGSVPDKESR